MKKYKIHTMGCKSNQYEGSVIESNLKKHGMEKAERIEDADIYILNSCSVTHKSDNEAMYLLRSVKHKNPKILTVLTGCVAQIEKERLLENENIDYVVGNDEKLELYENLKSRIAVSDIMELREFHEAEISDMTKTRASVKIQDGCDNRCSYCIIPFARGRSRSADTEFIINQINKFAENGFKEVVFTGIHIGLWGKERGENLCGLLRSVEERTDIARYRLGSLNPLEITDELLDLLEKSKKFCPHFHLSLQSACDKTLKSMNRFYSTEGYLKQIEEINRRFDKPFLGSDIITGYAGESAEDFEITRLNLEKSGLTQIHTFPYSIREGTVGAVSDEQVEESVREARASVVKEISARKYEAFVRSNLGSVREVLVEKHLDRHDNRLKGVTRNYLTVHLDTNDTGLANTLQMVRLMRYENGKIYGRIEKGE